MQISFMMEGREGIKPTYRKIRWEIQWGRSWSSICGKPSTVTQFSQSVASGFYVYSLLLKMAVEIVELHTNVMVNLSILK